MIAYYIMLSGLSLCGVCLCIKNRSRAKDSIFLSISFAVLTVMSAIRYDVGVDYNYIYSPLYEDFMVDPASVPWEPGFKLLLSLICGFTQNYQALFVVTSIIIVLLVMIYYWLYSPSPFISVFLFIALSQYYCSMNFIRQMIAAAIAMYAFPLLKKRNVLSIVGYIAIVLLAASFHKSALILIPFFLINLIPINKYVLAAYAVATAVIYFNAHRIVELVTRYWYSSYLMDNIHMQVAFTPQFTVAVAVVFFIVFLASAKLKELDERNYLYVNYAFFTMFFVLMGTRYSVLDRFSMYFELLAPVGIAIIVNQVAEELRGRYFAPNTKKHAAVMASLLLVIFGGGLAIHQYALTMDHNGVVPYKIIFDQSFYEDYVDSLKEGPATVEIYFEPEEIVFEPDDISEFVPPDSNAPADKPTGASESQPTNAKDGEPTEVSLEDLFQ